MTLLLKAIPFFVAAVLSANALKESGENEPSPCLAPSAKSADMLESYRFADTTTDAGMITWRQSIGLSSVPVAQVTLVNDTTICRRAVTAFNVIMGNPRHVPAVAVDVVRYGAMRLIIRDPDYLEGEWYYEAVVDSAFNEVGVAAR